MSCEPYLTLWGADLLPASLTTPFASQGASIQGYDKHRQPLGEQFTLCCRTI